MRNLLWWVFWARTWWLHFTLQLTSQKQLCSQHENLLVWPEMLQSLNSTIYKVVSVFELRLQKLSFFSSPFYKNYQLMKCCRKWYTFHPSVLLALLKISLCFHFTMLFNNKSAFSNFLLLEITLVHCIFSQRFSFSHRHLRPLPSAKS